MVMVSAGHRRALCSLALIATIIVSGVRVGAAEWVQQDKLLASDPAQGDWFGLPVAMSGNTAVIGANGDDDNGAQSGSAYVFHNPGSGWQQVTKLSPLDASPAWMFSDSLAIDGNRVIAGTRHGEAAYIFEDSGGGWHQVAKLTGVGTESRFGDSVAIRGNTAVVGAWGDEGAAYVFEDDGTGWDRVARLTSPDAAAGAQFGWSVAVGDNVVMVGASGDFGHPAMPE